MATEIKFCGLTRPDDAAHAAALGAAYVGVIFAGGPRMLTVERAMDVLAPVPDPVTRVGVFANQTAQDILRIVERLRLGVVQLHGSFDARRVAELRRGFDGAIWSVVHLSGGELPDVVAEMVDAGTDVLLDAFVPGTLGGTGVALPWATLAPRLASVRRHATIVLAGGLRPENVGAAIAAVSPDVVDVSSGVESAPGVKDHGRMRAFRDAVVQAGVAPVAR